MVNLLLLILFHAVLNYFVSYFVIMLLSSTCKMVQSATHGTNNYVKPMYRSSKMKYRSSAVQVLEIGGGIWLKTFGRQSRNICVHNCQFIIAVFFCW